MVYFTIMMAVNVLRTVAVILFFFLMMTLGGVFALVRTMFGVTTREAFIDVAMCFSKWVLVISGIRLKVTGKENLDFSGPKVIVANHQAAFDVPILMAALDFRFNYLVKKELFDAPLFGWFSKKMGQIPVDRASSKKSYKMLKEAVKVLNNGFPLAIFPEGTRSYSEEVGPFKKGSLFIAVAAKARIIPAAIIGSSKIQKKGSLLINPTTVTVNIGKPIDIEIGQDDIMQRSDALNEELRERIISLKTEK